LWAELSVTLTYLKNRYPHARLKQEIPYVNWRKRHLSLHHLRRPGCVAYVNIPKQKQDGKLNVRAWKGIMVGYAFRTRDYRIWNPETNEVAETKHVKFQEDQEWKDWSKASDESVSNDKFYDAKDLLEDSEDEDNDPSLTPVKTPGPVAHRRDALPPVQPAVIHSPLQKLQKLKPPRPTRIAVRKPGQDGFDREEVRRTTGRSVGRVDVYYYGPDGKRLRSRKEVKDYCTTNGLTYEILDFDLLKSACYINTSGRPSRCGLSAAAESFYAAEEVRRATSPVPRRSARIEVCVRQPEAARPTCGWNSARIPYIEPQQSTIRCTFGFHLIADVVRTYVGDSPFQTDSDQSTYRSSPNESSDSEDEVPPPIAPRPARTLPAPPPVAPTTVLPPAAQRFPTRDIPPFVSTRKKDFSIATTPLRPTRVAHRTPVPHKPGWEREEVQRQSGATKGQWDVYYYAPGLRTALRSRPDIKAWCEVHLKEKYKADEYDFNPTHAVDSDSDDDVEQPRDAEVEPEVDNGEAETYSVRVYCAKVQEPSTYEEAMSSPESDKWKAA
uniref:MBD domain-containing protein n=1 Tax=Strigamia maritima TaxID=126957 RepID=T1IM28_STRMM